MKPIITRTKRYYNGTFHIKTLVEPGTTIVLKNRNNLKELIKHELFPHEIHDQIFFAPSLFQINNPIHYCEVKS